MIWAVKDGIIFGSNGSDTEGSQYPCTGSCRFAKVSGKGKRVNRLFPAALNKVQ